MKKFFPAEARIGILLIIIATGVMADWALHQSLLSRLGPIPVGLVGNGALCFLLAGVALMLPSFKVQVTRRRQTVIGGALIVFAAVGLAHALLNLGFSINSPILLAGSDAVDPRALRMPPCAALGFILAGLVLILKHHVRSRKIGLLVQIATFGVFMLGITAIVGHSLELNLLYPWYSAPRMSLQSGAAMLLVSVGLWFSWRDDDWYQSRDFFNDGEKLGFISVAVLTASAIAVAIAGLSAHEKALEHALTDSLPIILKSRSDFFNATVQNAISATNAIALRSDLHRVINQFNHADGNPAILSMLDAIGNDILANGVSGIRFFDVSHRQILALGKFATRTELSVPLDTPLSAFLVWDRALLIRSQRSVNENGVVIGSIELELPLTNFSDRLTDSDAFGNTGVIAVCAAQGDAVVCMPRRDTTTLFIPSTIASAVKQRTPMNLAIAGQSGVFQGLNFRGTNVIAAYMPLTRTGLGIVVRKDVEELYAPIREELRWSLPLLLALIVAGAVIIHTQIKPLVTKLLRSERDAVDKEKRMRTVVDNVGDGVIIINEMGIIERFNPAATEIFGYTPEEVVGNNVTMLMPESIRSAHLNGMENHRQTGQTKVIGARDAEMPGLRKDGTVFTMELTVTKMHVGDKSLFVGIMRDISMRKRASDSLLQAHADLETRVNVRTAELRKSNELLLQEIQQRSVIETALQRAQFILTRAQSIAHLGSWQMHAHSREAEWSDEFWRICGLNPTSADRTFTTAINAFHPADRNGIRSTVQTALQIGEGYRRERRIVRPDGTIRYVICQGEVLLDSNNQPVMLIGTILDVTDVKLALTALEESEARLREMAAHQDRIEQDERKRVAREIHDELGGVLTGIKSYLSYLVNQSEQQNIQPDVHLLEASSLANSAIDTVRRIITDLRPSVLDQLGIWAALDWYAEQFNLRTEIQCDVIIDDATLSIELDPERSTAVFRIVQESLTNVTRHAHANHVTIQIRTESDRLVIEIHDDGIGIAPATKRHSDSWGIVGMVERARYFGGDLDITGADGVGTTVTLRMPMEKLDV